MRAVLAAALLFAVPAVAAPHEDLVIGVASFPSTLNPWFEPEVIKSYILGFADRPVTAFSPEWRLECLLCTRVPTVENGDAVLEAQPDGSEGMAVTFRFKPGLQWGDGAPVGAADLAFTARVGRDPNSGFVNTHTWQEISRVDVVDPLTAVLHYKTRDYQFNALEQVLPEHLEAAVFDRADGPAQYIQQTLYNREPLNPGLYNGPYVITEFKIGSQVVLEANPHWNGAKPAFRRVVIKTIANTAALQANLLSGDVDMAPGEGIGMTLDQVISLERQQPDRFTYLYKPNLNYQHIDLQLDNPVLADVRVRQALLLGMDRQSVADRLMGGRVPVADTFVSPLEPHHATQGVPSYPFDPARARALLAEAGWKPGPDGVARNAAGDRLSVEFTTSAGVRVRELLEQILQSEWRKIGVEATIKNEPARTLFGETLPHRAFKGLAMYSWSMPVESSPRQILSGAQVPIAANNWGGTNYMDFRNAAMDADIDAVEQELDPLKRRVIWADIQRIYAEQLPVLPLVFGADAHVLPRWLKGLIPTGANAASSFHVEDWRAK